MSTKVIAFVDPGPNLAQYLSAVGDRLPAGYAPTYFALRVKSRSVLHRLGRPLHPRHSAGKPGDWPSHIRIDRDALVARLRKDADKALVARDAPDFRWLVGALDAFLDDLEPAGIFLWNGSGLAAAITEQLARARGIPLVFGENGYLPGTLQLDPQGVNAFSRIGLDASLDEIRTRDYSETQVQELDRLLGGYRAGTTPTRKPPPCGRVRPSPLAYLAQAWEDLHEREPSAKGNLRIPREIPPLPERFVFFPLQVRSDSQLTIHSPLYGNRLDEAIADLDRAVRAIDPGLKLVVKLHPADLGKTDYDPVAQGFPDVVWIGGGDVRTILQRAACVVTVNSTVGIEGMIYGKPVVTLGSNFYVREGLVHPVRDRSQLVDRLRAALTDPPDHPLTQQYLRYLYFHAFARGHWQDYAEASLDAIGARIVDMVERAR
ncbi:capsular biosynthesis protein [Thiorhodococcus minor]|uniref:Capsular biosynthesis protein n=1 Tax=Thiorhodococcus minor TaxID=57489 RepID=A0A6M0JUP7_9GAMM|nr:capsular biosynthesis protein [Thiorhodococcus minor]NEV60651.1 capsular biosynthesis protein [Thiorhodococcus minor]